MGRHDSEQGNLPTIADEIDQGSDVSLLRDMRLLVLQPNDTLVIYTTDGRDLRQEAYLKLRDAISHAFPGMRFLILDGGLEVGAIRVERD